MNKDMTPIDEYLASLTGADHDLVGRLYDLTRALAPTAMEEISYGMPTFKYKGKGLVAVVRNKNFLSVYPYCNFDTLHMDDVIAEFETTKGSLHFTAAHPISDELYTRMIHTRMAAIEEESH